MWKISLKGMWAHKRRLLRTCSAVLLGVAFLAGTLVLGDTMRAGFARAFSDAYAGSDVVVQGTESIGSESGEQRRVVPEAVLAELDAARQIARPQHARQDRVNLVFPHGSIITGHGLPANGSPARSLANCATIKSTIKIRLCTKIRSAAAYECKDKPYIKPSIALNKMN